jgi:L-threonylcarbamoyladenylate synthase
LKEIVDVKEGADWLLNNRILIHPTDGIWGLGCIATTAAITKLDKLKKRNKNKNYIILFHDIENALEHIESDQTDRKFIKEVWPGHITLVAKSTSKSLEDCKDEKNNIACRVSTHYQLNALIKKANSPFISTSANISGKEYANNLKDICNTFESNEVALFNHQLGGISKPSKIIMLKSKRVIRE